MCMCRVWNSSRWGAVPQLSRHLSLRRRLVTDSRRHVGFQQSVRRWFGLPVPGAGPQEDVGRGSAVWRQDIVLGARPEARLHQVQHSVDQGRWRRRPHRSRRGKLQHILFIFSAPAVLCEAGVVLYFCVCVLVCLSAQKKTLQKTTDQKLASSLINIHRHFRQTPRI